MASSQSIIIFSINLQKKKLMKVNKSAVETILKQCVIANCRMAHESSLIFGED